MVTVVNSQPPNSDSGTGWLIGVVLLILLVLVALFWGGPILRRMGTPAEVGNPPKIDVNVDSESQSTTTEENNENPLPDTPSMELPENAPAPAPTGY